jgi:outer membrane protein OmpA-like peptidoglycan-associated protein
MARNIRFSDLLCVALPVWLLTGSHNTFELPLARRARHESPAKLQAAAPAMVPLGAGPEPCLRVLLRTVDITTSRHARAIATRELECLMSRKAIVFTIGFLASLGQATAADRAYRAADIVEHFAPKPQPAATRGLCIGTEEQCGQAAPKPRTSLGFDLVVNFDYNSDELTRSAKQNLDEFAKALKDERLATAGFAIEGHTDGKGTDSYNLDLSERRARAVVRYLQGKGVDTAKLAPRGYGKSKPKAADPLDPTNRRVETRLRVE